MQFPVRTDRIVKNNEIVDGFLQFLSRMIEVVRNLLSLHDAENSLGDRIKILVVPTTNKVSTLQNY